jgi:WXXGXW repeat (2 copies)
MERTMITTLAHRIGLRRRMLPVALLLAGVAAVCGAEPIAPIVRVQALLPGRVYREMPVPLVETIPPAPVAGEHWVPGHWTWHDGQWHWRSGHYVVAFVPEMPTPIAEPVTAAPSPGLTYVPGHWRWGGTGWVWTHGAWVPG